MSDYIVQLENVTKSFKDVDAVKDLTLNIKQGEFLTLLGPSGCGKTTTLRMIAGFEKPTSGTIKINGEVVNNIEPYHREINTVFQNYSLFPHMTIFNNIAFGLKMKKVPKDEIKNRVMRVLQMVQLEKYAERKPNQLSGGQQQRIAIARAIVNNPKVLLLDEPLGALDLKLRKQMQLELKHLQQSLGITFIYVTHDQEEALTMSDRIVVMNHGCIEQKDLPKAIYEQPKTLFVANFIGDTNILKGMVTAQKDGVTTIQIGEDILHTPDNQAVSTGDHIHLSIRPEKIKLMDHKEPNTLQVKIKEFIYIGSVTKVVTELTDGQRIVLHNINNIDFRENETAYITWDTSNSIVYQQEKEVIPG